MRYHRFWSPGDVVQVSWHISIGQTKRKLVGTMRDSRKTLSIPRRPLLLALGAGLLLPRSLWAQTSQAPSSGTESYDWTAPPVGLKWAVEYASHNASSGFSFSTDEYEIESVSGDLVTYLQKAKDPGDGQVFLSRFVFWRFFVLKASVDTVSGTVSDNEYFDRQIAVHEQFWPWKIGSSVNGKHDDGKGDWTYTVEAFEDLDEAGYRGRVARVRYKGVYQGIPEDDLAYHDAKTGIRIKSNGTGGYLDGDGKVVTYATLSTLLSWSMP